MQAAAVERIDLDLIVAGEGDNANDRTTFDRRGLEDLARSIELTDGLLEPVVVRQVGGACYELIAGERRTRAYNLLHSKYPDDPRWQQIPAIVKDADDALARQMKGAENTARRDLNAIETAQSIQRMMELDGRSELECGMILGLSPAVVEARLLLLQLNDDIRHLIATGNMPARYGEIMARAGLDANRQALCMVAFNASKSPSPTWFQHEVVDKLAAEQRQNATLFDLAEYMIAKTEEIQQQVSAALPADPGTEAPSGTPLERAAYWRAAADAWALLGKSHKRASCLAAAAQWDAIAAWQEPEQVVIEREVVREVPIYVDREVVREVVREVAAPAPVPAVVEAVQDVPQPVAPRPVPAITPQPAPTTAAVQPVAKRTAVAVMEQPSLFGRFFGGGKGKIAFTRRDIFGKEYHCNATPLRWSQAPTHNAGVFVQFKEMALAVPLGNITTGRDAIIARLGITPRQEPSPPTAPLLVPCPCGRSEVPDLPWCDQCGHKIAVEQHQAAPAEPIPFPIDRGHIVVETFDSDPADAVGVVVTVAGRRARCDFYDCGRLAAWHVKGPNGECDSCIEHLPVVRLTLDQGQQRGD